MRRVLIVLLAALIIILGLAGVCLLDALPQSAVDVHMRNVTHELAEWKAEHSCISSPDDAVRAAEMLAYVQGYYVPSDGYHGTRETEDALQSQRQATIDSLVEALRTYTGEDFGADSQKWLEYLQPADSDAEDK